jgi:hypothetical protein
MKTDRVAVARGGVTPKDLLPEFGKMASTNFFAFSI